MLSKNVETARKSIRLCAGPCGRMTRSSELAKAEAPDTIVRATGGYCQRCKTELGHPPPPSRAPKDKPQSVTGTRNFAAAQREAELLSERRAARAEKAARVARVAALIKPGMGVRI